MIYLIIGILSLSVCVFIMLNYIFDLLSGLKNIRKTYSVKSNDDGYFILSLIVKLSDYLSRHISKINSKYLTAYTSKTDAMLKILDYPYTKFNGGSLFIFQLLCALGGICLGFAVAGFDFPVMFCAGFLFFMLPYIKVFETYKKKRTAVIKQLPNTADLLSVMLGAGIDFNNALLKIAAISEGYFAKEIETVNSKTAMGVNTKQALSELAGKYDIAQLNLFVRTLNSALESGAGISDSINKLSEQLKLENASIAEKKAQEAPVKMLIPMVLLMFPTIFILLFAPIIISFMASGGL